MQRLAFTATIKPDRVADYVECHKAVWPSVLDAIKRAGIVNYSIFMKGTELFFVMEADDIQGALDYLAGESEHNRWNREVTGQMFATLPKLNVPSDMPEVFRFEAD